MFLLWDRKNVAKNTYGKVIGDANNVDSKNSSTNVVGNFSNFSVGTVGTDAISKEIADRIQGN